MMNLAIRGLDANLGGQHADSFHNDLHKDLRADFILANPTFQYYRMTSFRRYGSCHTVISLWNC